MTLQLINKFFFKERRDWKPFRETIELADGQGTAEREKDKDTQLLCICTEWKAEERFP